MNSFVRCVELTPVFFQAFGDGTENPAVTRDHDGQRQQEQAAEGEHVVGRLVPVNHEALVRGALGELHGAGNGHTVEQQHLKKDSAVRGSRASVVCLLPIPSVGKGRGCL